MPDFIAKLQLYVCVVRMATEQMFSGTGFC